MWLQLFIIPNEVSEKFSLFHASKKSIVIATVGTKNLSSLLEQKLLLLCSASVCNVEPIASIDFLINAYWRVWGNIEMFAFENFAGALQNQDKTVILSTNWDEHGMQTCSKTQESNSRNLKDLWCSDRKWKRIKGIIRKRLKSLAPNAAANLQWKISAPQNEEGPLRLP